MPEFRTTVLTLAGLIGYLAFLAALAAKVLGYPVSWELAGVILLTSQALFNVDLGLDVFGFFGRSNTTQTNEKRESR